MTKAKDTESPVKKTSKTQDKPKTSKVIPAQSTDELGRVQHRDDKTSHETKKK